MGGLDNQVYNLVLGEEKEVSRTSVILIAIRDQSVIRNSNSLQSWQICESLATNLAKLCKVVRRYGADAHRVV